MTPVHFKAANKTFVSAEADRLPAHHKGQIITTCWSFTWRERLRLLFGGRLWAQTTAPVLGLDLKPPADIAT